MSIISDLGHPSGRGALEKQTIHLWSWMIPCLMLSTGIAHSASTSQWAGTGTIISVTLPSSSVPVKGWSVQRGLLGRPLMDDHNKQIGTVIDLVIIDAVTPYVLIIGVGGQFEMGGHAVALPHDAVVERNGLLHLVSASQESLKAMPRFSYDRPSKRVGSPP